MRGSSDSDGETAETGGTLVFYVMCLKPMSRPRERSVQDDFVVQQLDVDRCALDIATLQQCESQWVLNLVL